MNLANTGEVHLDAREARRLTTVTHTFSPGIVVTPSTVNAEMAVGAVLTRTVTISNGGRSNLQVDLAGLNTGNGDNGFGYQWQDSTQPCGPAFTWNDISATGTPVLGDENYRGPFPIGFAFEFYGRTITSSISPPMALSALDRPRTMVMRGEVRC